MKISKKLFEKIIYGILAEASGRPKPGFASQIKKDLEKYLSRQGTTGPQRPSTLAPPPSTPAAPIAKTPPSKQTWSGQQKFIPPQKTSRLLGIPPNIPDRGPNTGLPSRQPQFSAGGAQQKPVSLPSKPPSVQIPKTQKGIAFDPTLHGAASPQSVEQPQMTSSPLNPTDTKVGSKSAKDRIATSKEPPTPENIKHIKEFSEKTKIAMENIENISQRIESWKNSLGNKDSFLHKTIADLFAITNQFKVLSKEKEIVFNSQEELINAIETIFDNAQRNISEIKASTNGWLSNLDVWIKNPSMVEEQIRK